jgi:hypothetical protein
MLLNFEDECLILRNIGHEEEGTSSHKNLECQQAPRLEMRAAPTKTL